MRAAGTPTLNAFGGQGYGKSASCDCPASLVYNTRTAARVALLFFSPCVLMFVGRHLRVMRGLKPSLHTAIGGSLSRPEATGAERRVRRYGGTALVVAYGATVLTVAASGVCITAIAVGMCHGTSALTKRQTVGTHGSCVRLPINTINPMLGSCNHISLTAIDGSLSRPGERLRGRGCAIAQPYYRFCSSRLLFLCSLDGI